jgi:hypothetical protein
LTLNINLYIDERLDAQQAFFSKKSRVNKRYYYCFKSGVITISVFVPFLLTFFTTIGNTKLIVGFLSGVLALVNALEVFFKFHENWISYRTTAELLKQEKFLFLYRAGPYQNENADAVLVERVESLLAKEGASWAQLVSQIEKKNPT